MKALWPAIAVTALTLLGIYSIYYASAENVSKLSPQGCRMSWMSPSYILQSDFDELWTPLSQRYSLWLYREVEWDAVGKHDGNPVIFIPGNAGSSHQARSIASSAARQFYSSPGNQDSSFSGLRPLDVFTVDFNEDLSALHGPTLHSQREYVSRAISYILSTYRTPRRRVVIIGHSMGGIVAQSVLASPDKDGWNSTDIAAVITMSAPHSLPPARLDKSIEKIYREVSNWENSNKTAFHVPTLAICGGSTDALIPAETCALPPLLPLAARQYRAQNAVRRTAHTTSVSGIWTGVGHREMVWCHQVRWRVARAALEAGSGDAGVPLLRWFPSHEGSEIQVISPEGRDRDYPETLVLKDVSSTVLDSATLHLTKPPATAHTYLIRVPVSAEGPRDLTVLLAKGTILHPHIPLERVPHVPGPMHVTLYYCAPDEKNPNVPSASCSLLDEGNSTSRLIPLPARGKAFPDTEGVDESEGVVYWMGKVLQTDGWVALRVETEASMNAGGWIVSGFDQERSAVVHPTMIDLLTGSRHLISDKASFIPFKTTIFLPRLLSNALLVYKVDPILKGDCESPSLLPPLFHHISTSIPNSSESHFYVDTPSHPIFLATHSSGPFVSPKSRTVGSVIEVYTSGTCGIEGFGLRFDWRSSLGRAGSRYWSTLGVWTMGVVAFTMADSWTAWDIYDHDFLDPSTALLKFTARTLPILSLGLTVCSVLPAPSFAILGNGGEAIFAPLAPLSLILATGVAWIIWGVIFSLVCVIGVVRGRLPGSSRSGPSSPIGRILLGVSLCFLALFLVPVQLVYFVVLVRHIWRCSTPRQLRPSPKSRLSPPPPESLRVEPEGTLQMTTFAQGAIGFRPSGTVLAAQQMHLLLFLFALFPWSGAVLVVWVRTLATAGFWAPFRGEHNIFRVVFFMCLTESMDSEMPRGRNWWLMTMLTSGPLYVVSAFTFLLGARFSYGVYMMANFTMILMYARVLIH